jgi:WD40 repeat protein
MENDETPSLNITASIGFNRSRKDCMIVHPSDMHFIWASGKLLVIKSIGKEQNTYLKGHEGYICNISCSKNGDRIATGEQVDSGALAALIVWDFSNKERLFRVRYHT